MSVIVCHWGGGDMIEAWLALGEQECCVNGWSSREVVCECVSMCEEGVGDKVAYIGVWVYAL